MLHIAQSILVHIFDKGGGLAIIMGGAFLAAGFGTSYRPEDIPEKYR